MHHTFLDTVRRRSRFAAASLETAWDTVEGEIRARDVPDPHDGPEAELMQIHPSYQ
jgi:hypothetical protein